MKKIHLILILVASLWNVLPAGNPVRALFDLVEEDPASGDVVATTDPDTDPIMIITPPPR